MDESHPNELNLLLLNHNPATGEPATPKPEEVEPKQPEKVYTCIERATYMIDNITDSLYTEILTGLQSMHKRKPIPKEEDTKSPEKKRSVIMEKPVDIDLHRRMIRKFMRMNRRSIKSIEQRSVEFEEEARKIKETEITRRNEEKNKTLEVRREKISERLKSKEILKQEIQKFVVESNKNYGVVKKTKFLYQEKEEAFQRDVLLPKIEEQKRILSKIKERAKPIDINEILQHQKLYEEKLVNDRLNRSLTSRVLQNENYYEAPKFVSKAFLIAEAEEELRREEEKMKEQEVELNDYRKREFIKIMEEKHRLDMEKQKELALEKSRSNKTFSVEPEKSKRDRPRPEPTREETKKIGNEYMKQLISLNRSIKQKPPISEFSSERSIKLKEARPKSEFEIELIKEERIEKVQKIRLRKIEDILNSKSIDDDFKLQRLRHENDKFDTLLSRQDDPTKKSEADELASIVLSSIHTKLAILEVASPRREQ